LLNGLCSPRSVSGIYLAHGTGVPAGDKKGPDKAHWSGLANRSRCSTISTRRRWSASPTATSKANQAFRGDGCQGRFRGHEREGPPQRPLDRRDRQAEERANVAKTDFEKKAVAEMKAGKSYYEEVAEVDGKPMLRAATIVPVVLKQCAVCHGKKEGTLLGAIVYELPIK